MDAGPAVAAPRLHRSMVAVRSAEVSEPFGLTLRLVQNWLSSWGVLQEQSPGAMLRDRFANDGRLRAADPRGEGSGWLVGQGGFVIR